MKRYWGYLAEYGDSAEWVRAEDRDEEVKRLREALEELKHMVLKRASFERWPSSMQKALLMAEAALRGEESR